jgi:hypothetical protein
MFMDQSTLKIDRRLRIECEAAVSQCRVLANGVHAGHAQAITIVSRSESRDSTWTLHVINPDLSGVLHTLPMK